MIFHFVYRVIVATFARVLFIGMSIPWESIENLELSAISVVLEKNLGIHVEFY